MIARELLIRARINPDNVSSPCAGLIDSNQFRRQNGRAPGNFVAKIDCFAYSRGERERCQNKDLADQRRSHYLFLGKLRLDVLSRRHWRGRPHPKALLNQRRFTRFIERSARMRAVARPSVNPPVESSESKQRGSSFPAVGRRFGTRRYPFPLLWFENPDSMT